MTLYVTPIGLAIASVFWLVAALAILGPVWRRLKNKSYRWALFGPLLAAVLVLPYSDELWIAWNFHRLCQSAGVHVVRKVEVEGFLDDTSRSSSDYVRPYLNTEPSAIEQFDRDGYRFRESFFKDGKVWHVERVEGGLKAEIRDHPTARYHFRFAEEHHEVPAGFQLEKGEVQVIDADTGEVIARETWYNRYPGLVEGLWVRFFGNGMTQCPDPGKGPPREHLPRAALLPAATR